MDDDPHPDAKLLESLSQREREILALLAQNLSDRDIANRLFLAYTTVKWYNRQIFSKLSVENRQQAVERATHLGLLSSSKSSSTSIRNLPAPLTPFIGRIGELEDLSGLFNHPNTRFVTILAPGGMGKTRLALAAAEDARSHFADGVTFISLAALASVDALITTIADAIGLQFSPDNRTLKQQILDFLQNKHTLLVLDNFEHLLEGGSLILDLLSSAAYLKVLVTSRERLNLEGETVYPLGGLPYPEQINKGNLLDYGAAQLFVECARRANSHFIVEDEANIVRVCQLVQGMPLALEMAAAWIGMLSPAEIGNEIAHSADFLRTTLRNFPERLRSVRAVFETTWKRLSDKERQGFRRLSVFRGGCTREAAHVVTGIDLVTLASLVNKALLWYQPGDGRYAIHELLRQYAMEQLAAAGEAETIQDAHRDYFGQLAHEWGSALKTPQQLLALDMLESDLDNIRESFRRAIETRNPEVIEPFADLWFFYEIRARYVEGEKLFGTAVEALKGQDSLALGRLLAGQAVMNERFYRFDQERRLAEQSIEVLRRVGAERETPFSMTAHGVGTSESGDMDRAVEIFREALPLARAYRDLWTESILLYLLGIFELRHERYAEAKHLFSQSYTLLEKTGNHWGLGFVLRSLGAIAYEAGEYDEARRLYEGGLASAQKVRHLLNMSGGLNSLSSVALAQGDLLQAKHFAEDALKINHDMGDWHMVFWATVRLAEIATAAAAYGEAREYLREALKLFPDLTDPAAILSFAYVVTHYLAQTGAGIHVIILVSFLRHYPTGYWFWFTTRDREKLQSLAEQMQFSLSDDAYTNAWTEGKSLTLEEVLSKLHDLI